MPELPVLSARRMVSALQRLGFEPVRQRGSHLHLRQARITADELRKAMK